MKDEGVKDLTLPALQLYGGRNNKKMKTPEREEEGIRTENFLLNLPFGSLEGDSPTGFHHTNRGKLQLKRNDGVAYFCRERTGGSQDPGYGQEGFQSFLGSHHEKVLEYASQGGHQRGARSRAHRSCSQGSKNQQPQGQQKWEPPLESPRPKASLGALRIHGNPHRTQKSRDHPPKTGLNELYLTQGQTEQSSLKEQVSDQTPQPLPQADTSTAS